MVIGRKIYELDTERFVKLWPLQKIAQLPLISSGTLYCSGARVDSVAVQKSANQRYSQ